VKTSVTDGRDPPQQRRRAHAHALSLRRGDRRAAAGRHVHPPTSPTTRAVTTPKKVRSRRGTVVATARIKWPGPLPSKDDPRAARAPGSKNLTLEECDYRPVASKPAQRERAPWVPSIYEKLLISCSRAGPAENPRNPWMRKDGGTQLPLRNGPTDQGFKTRPSKSSNRCPRSPDEGARIQAFPRAHRLEGAPQSEWDRTPPSKPTQAL
jgi:hypothetical protein